MKTIPLQRQLESLLCLNKHDMETLNSLLSDEKTAEKNTQLIREDQSISNLAVLSKGWAIRYKTLEDGRRQVLNFILPGDIIGFFALLFKKSEHGVEALTPLTYHRFSSEQTLEAFCQAPCLAIAMSWLVGRAERQLSEQVMRVGRRAAAERMAHLFIELYTRLLQVGICPEEAKQLPLTQTLLADTLGMSHIHANRSFKNLVREKLVALDKNNILLLDIVALKRYVNFDAGYLAKGTLPKAVNHILGNSGH